MVSATAFFRPDPSTSRTDDAAAARAGTAAAGAVVACAAGAPATTAPAATPAATPAAPAAHPNTLRRDTEPAKVDKAPPRCRRHPIVHGRDHLSVFAARQVADAARSGAALPLWRAAESLAIDVGPHPAAAT